MKKDESLAFLFLILLLSLVLASSYLYFFHFYDLLGRIAELELLCYDLQRFVGIK